MVSFEAKVRRLGGSKEKPTIGITIPFYIVKQEGLKKGDKLELETLGVN